MRYLSETLFIILLYLQTVFSNILRVRECSLYDAEFGNIRYNVRLSKIILLELNNTSLLQCETQCTLHPQCLSVNYLKKDSFCELVDSEVCEISHNLVDTPGWRHYGTLDKRAVSSDVYLDPILHNYLGRSNYGKKEACR